MATRSIADDARQIPWQYAVLGGCVLAVSTLVYQVYQYWRARGQFDGPPVKNWWKGNLDQTMMPDIHDKWRSWHRRYGPVFQTWNGCFSRVVYVGDPAIVAAIANANWPKAMIQYSAWRPMSGNALFMPKAHEQWLRQRKSLAPAFGPMTIKLQYPVLAKYLQQYSDHIGKAADENQPIDLSPMHVLLTLDFVGEIGFGTELNALKEGPDCRIMQIFNMILPEFMRCGLFPLRAKFPIKKETRDMFAAIEELRAMAHAAVVKARRSDTPAEKPAAEKNKKRIFEILLEQRNKDGSYTFSDKDLVDNYVTFLVAGGDPTAHALSFAVYEVIRKPEIMKKLRAEIDAAIPSPDVIPEIDSVKLPYLNAVIKETLRYNGPGFGTFRYCAKDTEVNGVTLPANTTLALWNPQVHRDPNVWGEDADEFNPERWLKEDFHLVPGSYFPFSYGPRNCLGQGLAMLELALTIATVFRKFDLSLKPGFEMEFNPSFTLCPKNGLWVYAKRRTS